MAATQWHRSTRCPDGQMGPPTAPSHAACPPAGRRGKAGPRLRDSGTGAASGHLRVLALPFSDAVMQTGSFPQTADILPDDQLCPATYPRRQKNVKICCQRHRPAATLALALGLRPVTPPSPRAAAGSPRPSTKGCSVEISGTPPGRMDRPMAGPAASPGAAGSLRTVRAGGSAAQQLWPTLSGLLDQPPRVTPARRPPTGIVRRTLRRSTGLASDSPSGNKLPRADT